MFRGWLPIFFLLVWSLGATATVHAAESGAAAELSCGGITHDEPDTGQTGSEQGLPHYHATCHGHNVTASPTVLALAPVMASHTTPFPSQPVRLARRTIDPALKPPKA